MNIVQIMTVPSPNVDQQYVSNIHETRASADAGALVGWMSKGLLEAGSASRHIHDRRM